jgi:hypothetical protein
MGKRIVAASQTKIVSSGKTLMKTIKSISMVGNQNEETAGSNDAC